MHPFSRDCRAASLCSYTFYSGWRTYTYTTRGQQWRVPQTLHLKWYIKATCLKILHMIDVSNDSVFSVWKSYVCFSLQLRSPRKENVRAAKQTKEDKKRKTMLSIITEICIESNRKETIHQRQWIKLIILSHWSSESIRELHTMSHSRKQSLFTTNIPINSLLERKPHS